jgi:hypothetical protein
MDSESSTIQPNLLIQTFMNSLDQETKMEEIPTEPRFELFPKLVIELRTLIWRATFSQRTIMVHRRHVQVFYSDHRSPIIHPRTMTGPYEHPAALSVNSESRTVALRYYRQIMKDVIQSTSYIYFNPQIDMLADDIHSGLELQDHKDNGDLPYDNMGLTVRSILRSFLDLEELLGLDRANLDQVRHIAVGNATWTGTQHSKDLKVRNDWYRRCSAVINAGFQNLRTITLVLPEDQSNDTTGHRGYNIMKKEGVVGQKICKKDLGVIFQEVKTAKQNFCVPEMIIINHDDPSAPEFSVRYCQEIQRWVNRKGSLRT